MRRTAVVSLLILAAAGCGLDRRCYLRPPPDANYGPCDMSLPNYAYLVEANACAPASGCTCDANCQANELPFSSRSECESVCMP